MVNSHINFKTQNLVDELQIIVNENDLMKVRKFLKDKTDLKI